MPVCDHVAIDVNKDILGLRLRGEVIKRVYIKAFNLFNSRILILAKPQPGALFKYFPTYVDLTHSVLPHFLSKNVKEKKKAHKLKIYGEWY